MSNAFQDLEISRLGAQGDGIAQTPGGSTFVPLALPGEQVRMAGGGARLLSAPSPDRAEPACRHFGACGGCAAQHMSARLYGDWKRGILVDALRQRGLPADVGPLVRLPTGSRRRAVLTARRDGPRMRLGYHRRRGSELIGIEECPVLEPAISRALPALRAVAMAMPQQEMRFTVLATPAGLDVAVTALGRVGPGAVSAFGRIATEHGLARIAINGAPVIERAVPSLAFDGIAVEPPPGAFVQAAEPAEREIIRILLANLAAPKRVADLFCGLGTLTLPLARRARVLAIDADAPSIAALQAAARRAQGLKPVDVRVRDLFREPMSVRELQGFDAVVLDPPRAGARDQAAQLARSQVPTIVAVSCDAGTMARDLRTLIDGGYVIESIAPIDQFLFSAEIEAVAVLRRSA